MFQGSFRLLVDDEFIVNCGSALWRIRDDNYSFVFITLLFRVLLYAADESANHSIRRK